jgi:hypothetical protein
MTVFVEFVEDATETTSTADVQPGDAALAR